MRKAINHLKVADPVLRTIIERIGPYRMQFRDPNFHTLVRSIVYQQLSGKAALTIFNRLIAAAKADPLTPESILKLRPARMRTLGLSKQKLTYIRELARMTRDGQVRFVRAAIKKAYNLPELPTPAQMEKIASAWRPYCSVASWYLWRSLDNQGAM